MITLSEPKQRKKELIKANAIKQMFYNKTFNDIIDFGLNEYNIPIGSDIKNDVIQTVMEELCRYPTDSFITKWLDNPARMYGVAKTIMIRKGLFKDKRFAGGFKNSEAQRILHQSTFDTLQYIDITCEHNLQEFTTPYNDDEQLEYEENYSNMWLYVKEQLTSEESEFLKLALKPTTEKKLKIRFDDKKVQKQYNTFLKKLKTLITTFKTQQTC